MASASDLERFRELLNERHILLGRQILILRLEIIEAEEEMEALARARYRLRSTPNETQENIAARREKEDLWELADERRAAMEMQCEHLRTQLRQVCRLLCDNDDPSHPPHGHFMF